MEVEPLNKHQQRIVEVLQEPVPPEVEEAIASMREEVFAEMQRMVATYLLGLPADHTPKILIWFDPELD